MNFTPSEEEKSSPDIPWFEDARADFAPYYNSRKSIVNAKNEIGQELGKLDAQLIRIQQGHFGDGRKKRNGYIVHFVYKGHPGQIKVAALPIYSYTVRKKERALLQALLNVRDWLKTSVTQSVFSPGSSPLITKLLGPDGRSAIEEYIMSGHLTQLGDGRDVVDGEFVDE